MNDYVILTSEGEYTIFKFNNERIKFATSKRLERYTKIIEWDHGYLVVNAKYKDYIRIINLNRTNHAAVIYNNKIVETNMDDIESQIVLDCYIQNKEFIEEKAYA